jgi:hypothetical protein
MQKEFSGGLKEKFPRVRSDIQHLGIILSPPRKHRPWVSDLRSQSKFFKKTYVK